MNKVIIVTGASKGIGKEIAKEQAKKGNTIIANYNKSEKEIKELQQELENQNIKIDIFQADISKREEAKKIVNYTIQKYGKIDVLINNAGISQIKEFTQITDTRSVHKHDTQQTRMYNKHLINMGNNGSIM